MTAFRSKLSSLLGILPHRRSLCPSSHPSRILLGHFSPLLLSNSVLAMFSLMRRSSPALFKSTVSAAVPAPSARALCTLSSTSLCHRFAATRLTVGSSSRLFTTPSSISPRTTRSLPSPPTTGTRPFSTSPRTELMRKPTKLKLKTHKGAAKRWLVVSNGNYKRVELPSPPSFLEVQGTTVLIQ